MRLLAVSHKCRTILCIADEQRVEVPSHSFHSRELAAATRSCCHLIKLARCSKLSSSLIISTEMPNFDAIDNAIEADEREIERNIEYSVEMMRWLLQVMGLWPYVSYPKILRMLLILVVSFLLVFFTLPIALYILIVVRDFKASLQLLGPLSFGFMNIFKFYSVLFQEKQLRECVEWMASDWRSVRSRVENDLMLENAKSAKTFTIICVTCMYMGGMSYGGLFSFVMDPVVVNNKTTKVLAYPSYFIFFNPYEHFKLIYIVHVMCTFAIFTITLAVESIGIVCVMHVCGQITVISWRLRNLAAGTFDKTIFGQIIEKHLRAITFAEKLEDYLNSICFVELVGCCFNICMLGYYIITDHSQNFVVPCTYCLLFVSFTFNIFIFCYIGDQLTEKCGNIGSAAYNVDWYHLSAKDARNLLMIVVSTKHPIILTAGKMAVLSLTCFSSVLKASFSYLNMLRTVT